MEIRGEIRKFIDDQGRPVGTVSDGESLLEAGILDSVGVLQLVAFIEERYGIVVSEDEMMPENFDTIEAIADFVTRRQAARHG